MFHSNERVAFKKFIPFRGLRRLQLFEDGETDDEEEFGLVSPIRLFGFFNHSTLCLPALLLFRRKQSAKNSKCTK